MWAVLVAVPGTRAAAQALATDTGVLTGRVVDAGGRPVAGARVRVELEDGTASQRAGSAALGSGAGSGAPGFAASASLPRELNVLTGRAGGFAFLRLGAGTYRVSVASGAEAPLAAGTVRVEAAEPAYAVLRLPAEMPGVRGSAALVILAPSVPDTEAAAELPAAQAGSGEAAGSAPGDRADTPREDEEHAAGSSPEDSPRSPAAYAAGLGQGRGGGPVAADALSPGLRQAETGSTLDGLSLEQGFRSGRRGTAPGGPGSGTTFSRDAVGSLRAMPRSYSASEGGPAGLMGGTGDAAVGSRAGAVGVHGAAFATLRMSAFDAANPYAVATHYHDGAISAGVVKPQDTDVQAGAHAGFAPLARSSGAWRERVLGFVSLEGRVRNAPVEATPALASFYALTPVQRALLGTRGVTAAQANAALNFLDGLSGSIPRSDRRLLSFGRLDLRGGNGAGKEDGPPRDAVAVTFAGNHFRSPAGAAFDRLAEAVVASGRGSVGDSALDVEAVAAHWAHRFGPGLENAARVQGVWDVESERPRAPLAGEPAISPGGEAPEVEIAPQGFTFGTPANLDRSAYPDERRVQVADTLRWAPGFFQGRHVLSVGGDWSRVADRIDSLRNQNGTFLYDSGDTGGRAGGLVDWITDATFNVQAYPNGGCPSINAAVHDFCFRTYTQSFGAAQQAFTTHRFAGFAEDSFVAGPSLRITLGARYEYTLLPLPQVPNAGLDASLRALALPEQFAGATGAFPEDRNNAGPRVGVAWAPHAGRWFTLRAGYGWFFGQLPGTTLRAALADNGLATGISQVRITPATETACPQVSNQGFGYPCAFVGAPPGAVAQTSTVVLFAERFRLPAVQRGSLAVERTFGRRFAVELGYAGAVATQLPTSVDVNIAPATGTIQLTLQGGADRPGLAAGRAFAVPLYTARRLGGVGPVTAITSQANATYHAGTLSARMLPWHGVAARGSVTFSRAIDDNPLSAAGLGSGPRVNGRFDPFAIGYDKGLSDLQAPLRFAGSVTARTSVRLGPAAVRTALSGWGLAASATAASGAPYSYEIFGGTRLPGGHASINGAGGATYLPTVGRNTLRLPARANVDLRLERGFAVRGVKLSGFAEAFNLLNRRNLSRVETRAFVPGTAVNGVTPLVFQDAAAVVAEGVTTPAFGTAVSSTSAGSRERLVAVGVRVEF